VLSAAEIDANARTFQEQAFSVLDRERVEVRNNGEWLEMPMDELFALARTATVAQIIEREDFAKRFAAHTPISILELLYPLLQGYDSVAVRADVELGGTDQKFNLLLGRDVQRAYGVPEQSVLTMPILPGTDGERRMSKSLGNYIGVTEAPAEMYGKTLSLPDTALDTWYRLLLGSSQPAELGPRDAKRALARSLVAQFHGDDAAAAAEQAFDRVHISRDVPEEIDDVVLSRDDGLLVRDGDVHLPALLARAFGMSTSEARRLIAQGGVKLSGEAVTRDRLDVPLDQVDGQVLQAGKRRFARARIES
jgi:tyrosyl-tRNA synthetase